MFIAQDPGKVREWFVFFYVHALNQGLQWFPFLFQTLMAFWNIWSVFLNRRRLNKGLEWRLLVEEESTWRGWRQRWKVESIHFIQIVSWFGIPISSFWWSNLQSWRVRAYGVRAGEKSDISHDCKSSLKRRRMIGLLAIGSEQKNPVSCGTGVLHRLAYEEDATETVPQYHASLKPHVLPRYHWAVQKHPQHSPWTSRWLNSWPRGREGHHFFKIDQSQLWNGFHWQHLWMILRENGSST